MKLLYFFLVINLFNLCFIFSLDFKTKSYFLQTALTAIGSAELEIVLLGVTNNKYFKNLKFKNKDLFRKIILGFPALIPIIYYLRGAIPSILDEKERIELFKNAKIIDFSNSNLEENSKIDDAHKIFVPGTYVRGTMLYKFFYYPFQAILGFRPYWPNYGTNIIKNAEGYIDELIGEDRDYNIKWSEKYKNFVKNIILPILKKYNYFYLNWTYDLYDKDREYASDDLKNEINKNLSKDIVIISHSYGGEVAIKALYKLFVDQNVNLKKKIFLCLVCTPLINETVEMIEAILKKGVRIISFHIEKDYIATGDPTNYPVFSSIWKGNVSDIKYLKKHKEELDKNLCAVLLEGVNSDVDKEKKPGGCLESAWQSAHGLVIYYILKFDLINKFINSFESNLGAFLKYKVPSINDKNKM
jgi:hypothetical protein